MRINLEIDGEVIPTTLESFLADNDGFDDSEIAAMTAAMAGSGKYNGGGGASPEYTLTRA